MTLTGAYWLSTIDEAKDRAITLGLVPVLPEANQLQIDLDSEEAWEKYQAMSEMLAGFLSFSTTITTSKSGLPGRHVTISLDDFILDKWQRLALQAALGSDLKRELLGCMRALHGDEEPSILFEVPIKTD